MRLELCNVKLIREKVIITVNCEHQANRTKSVCAVHSFTAVSASAPLFMPVFFYFVCLEITLEEASSYTAPNNASLSVMFAEFLRSVSVPLVEDAAPGELSDFHAAIVRYAGGFRSATAWPAANLCQKPGNKIIYAGSHVTGVMKSIKRQWE